MERNKKSDKAPNLAPTIGTFSAAPSTNPLLLKFHASKTGSSSNLDLFKRTNNLAQHSKAKDITDGTIATTAAPFKTPLKPLQTSSDTPARKCTGDKTPLSKTFKFNPDHATGIPLVKPKKTTALDPFHFGLDKSYINTEEQKSQIKQELASMDTQKRLINQGSSSVRKPPPPNRNLLLSKMSKTPNPKGNSTPLTHTFKYDRMCETGIPLVKPKKTTVCKPFKFVSGERAAVKKSDDN